MKKRFVLFLCLFGIAAAVGGAILFPAKGWAWSSLLLAAAALVLSFSAFEGWRMRAGEAALLAVLCALSVCSRTVFVWLPHFKPVSAMTIICGMYLGPRVGFFTGAMTALVSNFLFGQGPWTPFQMLTWGIIGFLSGALGGLLKKSRILLFLHGGLCGILFSLLMDLWSMVWLAGEASLGTWLALVATALPMTVTYAVSNILFLALLAGPIGRKLVRMQVRYGFFAVSTGE